jgi:DNA-binding response OmpR family regulator
VAGETIFIVDDSAAVQDIVSRVLEGHGYRTVTASNGPAALSFPGMRDVDLVIIDAEMSGFDGEDTIKFLRAAEETHKVPILLLAPESQKDERASQPLFGSNGYILKPFDPDHLARRVEILLGERDIERQAAAFVQRAADVHMETLAQKHIQGAIEKRTQIIAERAIQNVVTMVDQQARREVDAKVTSLSQEKEQELVKATVHEVAQSMVEKLAEKKVSEAMEQILEAETARAVKRASDTTLPGMIRERLRDSIENTLPREIQTRVQRAAEETVPEISEKIVDMIEGVARQLVPQVARERVPEIAERQLRMAIDEKIPRQVRQLVAQELDDQIRMKLNPVIESARFRIERRVTLFNWFLLAAVVLLICYISFKSFTLSDSGAADSQGGTETLIEEDLNP